MKMKKKLLFATAIIALASCADNTYLGDLESSTVGNSGVISFEMSTPTVSRASGSDAATELGNSFQVYATKTVSGDPDVTSNVFAQNTYSSTSNTPYWVWYQASTANTTTSNTDNWEYVGTGGSVITPAIAAQTIKYWDYAANQYDFVAFKAKEVSSSKATITNITNSGFTVAGSAAQLGALYVADKKVITSGDYAKVVQFTFRNAAARVRLGIYETIPGYDVKNVKFRPVSSEFTAATGDAKLCGHFNGVSSGSTGTYDVTYAPSEPRIAIFTRNSSATDFRSSYFSFGSFVTTALAESSINPTWATGSSDYQIVFPNTDYVDNMTLYVDYDLYNSTSGETIHVKGAKAVVPQAYMTWNPNYAYTYLFKISNNTNGYTGTEGSTPEGLYPITFDAVTIAATDGQEVGTITIVSTPAITTYQENSVYNNVSDSEYGITYAHANGPIYITVNTAGTLETLTDKIKLYKVASGTTEADLLLTTKTKTEVGADDADKLTILSSAETLQGITFATTTSAKFTPAAGQTYAVQYLKAAAVNYTSEQAAAYNATLEGAISTLTTLTAAQATTLNGLTGVSKSDYAEGETPTAADAILYNATLTGHVTTSTVKTPAVYQYKIIVVGS
jgi:hypothetical protein